MSDKFLWSRLLSFINIAFRSFVYKKFFIQITSRVSLRINRIGSFNLINSIFDNEAYYDFA